MTAYQTAMAAPSRRTCLRAVLMLATGYEYLLSDSEIIRFSLNEGMSGGSMLLGSAVSAHASLTLHNPAGAWQEGGAKLGMRTLTGAQMHVEIGVHTKDGILYAPAGSFIVSDVQVNESEGVITLSGYDALLHRFAPAFSDTLSYPCTVKSILDAILLQAGFTCTDIPACNADIVLSSPPSWGEGCTLRRALSYTLTALGCFARLDRQGQFMLLSANPQTQMRALSPDRLQSLTLSPGSFRFNRLRIHPRGGESDTYIEKALDAQLPAGSDNLITLDDNPLFRNGALETELLLQNLCAALQNLTLTPFEAEFPGDPTLEIGDRLRITDLSGHEYSTILFTQRIAYERTLSADIACEADCSGVSLPRILTSGGTLSSSALADGAISARHLKAGCVDAEKITARAITADHIALGALSSESGVIGDLSADQLTSGKVNTDRLIVGGTEFSIVRALNQLADSLSENDNSIDGSVLSDKSISAVKVTDDFGAGLELSSNEAVLLLAGKLDGTHSHMELTESAINMVGGDINIATDDLEVRGMQNGAEIMSLDPEGLSADRVVVRKEFYAPNAVLMNLTNTVPWRGGIQASLDACPKWLTQTTKLTVPAGTYLEDVVIRGFKGGTLQIVFAPGVKIHGAISMYQCDSVYLAAGAIGDASIYPRMAITTVTAVHVGFLEMHNLQISGYRDRTSASVGSYGCIECTGGAAYINNCCVEYANNYTILVQYGASGCVSNCFGGVKGGDYTTGANLGFGVYAAFGATLAVLGRCPVATTNVGGYLSTIHSAGGLMPTEGGMEYVPPEEITQSFAISKHCTYVWAQHRIRDDQSAQFGQGRWGEAGSGNTGWRTGAMWFASATAALAGKTVISATLSLRRASGGYNQSEVPVYLGTTALAEADFASTSTPPFTASAGNYPGSGMLREHEMTYDVTELMDAVKAGYAIALREPTRSYSGNFSAAYTNYYGKGSAYEPVLTVTYK